LTVTTTDLADFFSGAGPLAQCLDNFAPRAEQLAMAEDIARAIAGGRNLVIEAGTGTGKTLAYLVPVLLSGQRVVVSTRTRTLQDQLYHRDLPMIGTALGRPATVQLLKGRANYLCLYRLDTLLDGFGELVSESNTDHLTEDAGRLREWSQRTRTGDIAEMAAISEDSPLWPQVTSTLENCLGSRCSRFTDCHVVAARQAAREADIVVANHHLLMADLTMREEGFGELLPGADVVIVDEAHQFPDVAQSFFNISIGSKQIADLMSDIGSEAGNAGIGDQELAQALTTVQRLLSECRSVLPDADSNMAWSEAGEFDADFRSLGEALIEVQGWTMDCGDSGAGLQRCRERIATSVSAVQAITDGSDEDGLRWIRRSNRNFTANLTPLDSSAELGKLMNGGACSWVMTSATLAVGGNFDHFVNRLGLTSVETRQIPSPFDFQCNTRLYLPENMPQPGAPAFTEKAIAAALPLLRQTGGRAFLLFTSHRALRRAAEIIEQEAAGEFSLLVQGTAPRSRLLEQFSRLDQAVLLGTSTFWEGVDIRGDGLVLVVIDRLPFASPGDPLLAAKLESIRNHGGNPFRDYQLPQAVLSLKQGVGRLIRDYSDYGVVMICDPRLVEKSYGRVFLASLPSMPLTRHVDEVRDFLLSREGT
jgi:ATP-dependent DNA helicase DinG